MLVFEFFQGELISDCRFEQRYHVLKGERRQWTRWLLSISFPFSFLSRFWFLDCSFFLQSRFESWSTVNLHPSPRRLPNQIHPSRQNRLWSYILNTYCCLMPQSAVFLGLASISPKTFRVSPSLFIKYTKWHSDAAKSVNGWTVFDNRLKFSTSARNFRGCLPVKMLSEGKLLSWRKK